MKFKITSDQTQRTILFKVSEVDPLKFRQYGWPEEDEGRFFQPEHGALTIVDGQRQQIVLLGPRILKGGKLSDNLRGKARWTFREMTPTHTDAPPAWILDLWAQVPDNHPDE